MSETPPSLQNRLRFTEPPADVEQLRRELRNFRYVVGAVNDDALKVWADIWDQFKSGVTPAGVVLPQIQEGFKPSCGWGEFLEKVWLLKHYLDYVQRFCRETT